MREELEIIGPGMTIVEMLAVLHRNNARLRKTTAETEDRETFASAHRMITLGFTLERNLLDIMDKLE